MTADKYRFSIFPLKPKIRSVQSEFGTPRFLMQELVDEMVTGTGFEPVLPP
jgi:hypothetical protein